MERDLHLLATCVNNKYACSYYFIFDLFMLRWFQVSPAFHGNKNEKENLLLFMALKNMAHKFDPRNIWKLYVLLTLDCIRKHILFSFKSINIYQCQFMLFGWSVYAWMCFQHFHTLMKDCGFACCIMFSIIIKCNDIWNCIKWQIAPMFLVYWIFH